MINLQKIVSVKGHPGLFHLLNYNTRGYFLQPFTGGQTRFFDNEKGRVLAVGNVDLRLSEGSVNVLDLFRKIDEHSAPLDVATTEEVRDYFQVIQPNLHSSVAPSHLLKVLKWYHLIKGHFQETQMVNEEDDGLQIV